jgi:hypothetical protein
MVAYIQGMVREILDRLERDVPDELGPRCEVLAEELNRLDPRDFPPDKQLDFTLLRMRARLWGQKPQQAWADDHRTRQNGPANISQTEQQIAALPLGDAFATIGRVQMQSGVRTAKARLAGCQRDREECLAGCKQLLAILDCYGGQGSGLVRREFPFIRTPDLRVIVQRDYRELAVQLLPSGAWKSAVVLAGSILEAILFDQLTWDYAASRNAMISPDAPRKKGGQIKEIKSDAREDEWTLSDMIRVCVERGILPQPRAEAIDQVLRDYRNFVHPRKEIRSGHPCTEAEATLAKGALDAVINHLTPPPPATP